MQIRIQTTINSYVKEFQIVWFHYIFAIDSYTCFVVIVHNFIPNVHRLIFFQVSLKKIQIAPISC